MGSRDVSRAPPLLIVLGGNDQSPALDPIESVERRRLLQCVRHAEVRARGHGANDVGRSITHLFLPRLWKQSCRKDARGPTHAEEAYQRGRSASVGPLAPIILIASQAVDERESRYACGTC